MEATVHEISDCLICNQAITNPNEEKKCDICSSKFHERCAKENDNMQTWVCVICTKANNSLAVKIPGAPKSSSRSKIVSRGAPSTTSSSKAKAMLEALEEEKQLLKRQAEDKQRLLNETHEQELLLLKKKQEVLQEIASSKSCSSRKSNISVPKMSSHEKVESWIKGNNVGAGLLTEQVQELTTPEKRTENEVPSNNNPEQFPSETQIPKPLMSSTFEVPANPDALNQNPQVHFQTQASKTKWTSTFQANTAMRDDSNQPKVTQDQIQPKAPMTKPVSSLYINKQNSTRFESAGPSRYKHNLSREEVAARHVIKDLPTFDGTPKSWPKFITSFNRGTDICGFSDVENLERLSNSLKGRAYKAVETSLSLEENVPRILETLEMLFGKPEFIISSLIDDMEKSKPPTADSIDSIIEYALEVENISTTMKIAKLSDHLWNPKLLTDMIKRLPHSLKIQWAEHKYTYPQSNIEVFSSWLKNKAMTYATVLEKPPSFERASDKPKTKHSINVHQESQHNMCIVCSKSCKSVEDCENFKSLKLNDKWDAVRKYQLCRICLTKHRSTVCFKNELCGLEGCTFRHHSLLHKPKTQEVQQEEQQHMNVHQEEAETYFKILPVRLMNGTKSMTVYAMMDDGSSITLIDSTIARKLGLSGENQPLCLRWTGNIERRDAKSEVVNLNVSPTNDSKQVFTLSNVRTVEDLNLPKQSVDMAKLAEKYKHLRGIPIPSFNDVQPSILIGLNHTKLMSAKKYRFGGDDEPAAAKTVLGWCIFGAKTSMNSDVFHINHCECNDSLDRKLEDMVQENYSLEAIGVSSPTSTPRSKDDVRAYEILAQTTKFNGQRYEVGLLWKYADISLPGNWSMAIKRQRCLEKRFQEEPELPQIINTQIEDYVAKGYARKLSKNESTENSWFLPIFIVRNPNKPGKIRLVWDAAARSGGVSLNQVLLKGPDLLSSLPGVLLRFREHQVAFTGDIKEMFHQVEIRKEDRRYQRFIWRESVDAEFDVYEMNVMTFGASCSPCCSQYVKNVNAEKFRDDHPEAVEAIQQNHYVDDWLESVDSSDQAILLAKKVQQIHRQGGFEIRNWVSNNQSVVQNLTAAPSCEIKNLEISPKPEADKILGMFWTTSDDAFTYILKIKEANASIFDGDKIPTKREFLRILMSVFDPLGLIANILIFPKILLQRIWRSKIGWDDEIEGEHHSQWMLWTKGLHKFSELRIPRWVGLYLAGSEIEMHCFVDASEDAFAAAIYFKVVMETGLKCSLITAKSRVAPLQGLTVPRLELQAAVLGIRLATFVQENLSKQHKIVRRYFWTDSETVVKWLRSDSRRYSQYVGCRIGEILESSKVYEWNWLAGAKNVADMATKMRIQEVVDSSDWFQGPSFLYETEYPLRTTDSSATEEELRPQHQHQFLSYHSEAENRIGKWNKLRRTYAFVYRYINNFQSSFQRSTASDGPLTTSEYIQAENYLFKKAQMDDYKDEYMVLKNGKILKNKRSVIYKDTPFLDEFGVLRSRSRIQSTPFASFNTKNPILLPKNHRITEMILQYYHEKYHHQFVATVANEVKQKFIIPTLKVKLKSIRRQCQFCKNRDAKPDVPIESELPPSRLTPFTLPFTFIGIDYFGPINVRVNRGTQKRWCMLVTCLTTRAVHLEVAHTLSTDSCIMGLRRFISRRGKPREIFTDNGTNFRGSRNELREIWKNINKQKLAETFVDTETKWMFIPPASPHMGGAWERMVRSVKRALEAAMPFRLPNDELLLTMLAEVENIINNRPLTYVSVENESEEALTPNHFILGSTSGVKPLGSFQDDSSSLRANWQKAQLFVNVFWKRWSKEYLPSLSRRTKWFTPNDKDVKVGDVVILLGEEKTGNWPKGKVLEVYLGRDGHVRSASVKLSTGIYTRPVSKLAVLDVRAENTDGTLESSTRIPGGTVKTHVNPPHTTTPHCDAQTNNSSVDQIHNEKNIRRRRKEE